MTEFWTVPHVVVLVAVAVAAVTDIWKFRVYNILTAPLALSGLAYHGIVNGWSGLGGAALGVLTGFGLLLPFYLAGGMGAGDVKLLKAIGAWLGALATLQVFLASCILAGLYMAILLIAGEFRKSGLNWQALRSGLGLVLMMKSVAFLVCRQWVVRFRHGDSIERAAPALRVTPENRRWSAIPFSLMMAVGFLAVLALPGW